MSETNGTSPAPQNEEEVRKVKHLALIAKNLWNALASLEWTADDLEKAGRALWAKRSMKDLAKGSKVEQKLFHDVVSPKFMAAAKIFDDAIAAEHQKKLDADAKAEEPAAAPPAQQTSNGESPPNSPTSLEGTSKSASEGQPS